MNSLVKLLALAAAGVLAACSTPQPPEPVIAYKTKTVDTACNWTRVITVANEDVLTDETARQILAHDRAWKVHCGK